MHLVHSRGSSWATAILGAAIVNRGQIRCHRLRLCKMTGMPCGKQLQAVSIGI